MNFSLKPGPPFVDGVDVELFAASDWPASTSQPAGAPPGAAVATETIGADGTVSFTAIDAGNYWAVAHIGSVYYYIDVDVTAPPSPAPDVTPSEVEGQVLTTVDGAVVWADSAGGSVEDWHIVGEEGEPEFENGATSSSGPDDGTAPLSFCKDPLGFVHLRGGANGGSGGTLFTLPAGYIPDLAVEESFIGMGVENGAGIAVAFAIYDSGGVTALGSGPDTRSVYDGITFRAA